MSKKEFYTKGDCNNILHRTGQVNDITLYCPAMDMGINELIIMLNDYLPGYKTDEHTWTNVPKIDALNVLVYTSSFCKENGINMDFFSIVAGSFSTFQGLKYITFSFRDDMEILNIYKKICTSNKTKKSCPSFNDIFKVNVLEMNLSDMFSQNIIDIVNKVLMVSELIPNSVLKRQFSIEFTYDEYVSFMHMFLDNNEIMFNQFDDKICDYFMTFPELVGKHKPRIRMITNYKDL